MNSIDFNPFPEIRTERFLLRQLDSNDAQSIFELRSNEEIGTYLNRPKAKSIDDAFSFIEMIESGINKNEVIYWGISEKDKNKIIGTVTLWQISADRFKAEIGFELFPKHQGGGVMSEILPEVIKFGFDKIGLSLIEGEVDPKNEKSVSLMKKFSFTKSKNLDKTVIYSLKKH